LGVLIVVNENNTGIEMINRTSRQSQWFSAKQWSLLAIRWITIWHQSI